MEAGERLTLLEQVADQVGETTITAIISSEDPEAQERFIAEAMLLAGAALLLSRFLEKYLDGVADGLGIEDLGVAHGRWARRLLARLRSRKALSRTDLDEAQHLVERGISVARQQRDDDSRRSAAASVLMDYVVSSGATRMQALQVLTTVETIVFGTHNHG